MDATRDQLWGQLLLERGLIQQGQLQQLVMERDQRLQAGQDASLGQLMVQKRWIDGPAFGRLRVEIEGRGRFCRQCARVFLAANHMAPPACPACGSPAQLPPSQDSSRLAAVNVPGSGRYPGVPGSGRFPTQAPGTGTWGPGGAGSGSFARPQGSAYGTGFGGGSGSYTQPMGTGAFPAGGPMGTGAFPANAQLGSGNFQAPMQLGSGNFQAPGFAPPGSGSYAAPGFGGMPVMPGAMGSGNFAAPGLGSGGYPGGFVGAPGSTAPGMESNELETGELGIGKKFGVYEITEELGRGGMGVVYKARDARRGRFVAIKVLLAGEFASPRLRERFQEESKLASRLMHPNIVPVHDIGEVDGLLYYTMDFVEGQELQEMIRSKSLPIRRGVELLVDVARAAQHAHEHGVVHRDLKPSNILVSTDGTPYIMDFGLAKNLESDKQLTKSGVAIGTPYYMPPEQARGHSKEMDARSDIYAIGAILYEVITRKVPFTAKTQNELLRKIIEEEPLPPRQVRTGIPADLETICLKALRKEKDKRYLTSLEMAEDMERFLAGEPIKAKPPAFWEPIVRKIKRNKTQSIVIASATLAVLLAIVILAVVRSSYQDQLADTRRDQDLRDEEERATLTTWLIENIEKSRPVTEEDRAAYKAMSLDELRSEKVKQEGIARDVARRQGELRSRLQEALTRGQNSYSEAREALSSADARASFERADTEYTEAIKIQRQLKEPQTLSIYQRALIRRSLCRWKAALEDFQTAAKSKTHQARAHLARALIKLRIYSDRNAALDVFKLAVPAEGVGGSGPSREEEIAARIAVGYTTYLKKGYEPARGILQEVAARGKLLSMTGEVYGALAYLERSEGEALGGDRHAARGLVPSKKASEASRFRFEFQVDRAIILARSKQAANAIPNATAAQHAARDLDLDSEWADLASAVIQAVTNRRTQMDQALETAIGKARGRSPQAEQEARAFASKLRKAELAKRKRQSAKNRVQKSARTFSRVLRFNGSGRIPLQVDVAPDVIAMHLRIVGIKRGDLDIFVGYGPSLQSDSLAVWKAVGRGNEELVIHKGSAQPLRSGIHTVVVSQIAVRGQRPIPIRAKLEGRLLRKGDKIPWVWESLPELKFGSQQDARVVSSMIQRYQLLQEREEAKAGLKAFEERNPNRPMIAALRVDLLLQELNYPAALKVVVPIVKRHGPKTPAVLLTRLAHAELAIPAHRKQGEKRFAALLKRFPRVLEVHEQYALGLIAAEKPMKALDVVRACKAKQDKTSLSLREIECLLAARSVKSALELIQQLLANPASGPPEALSAMRLLRKYGAYEEHAKLLNAIYKQQAQVMLDIEMATALAEQGKLKDAEARMARVRNRVPEQSRPLIDKIRASLSKIKPRKAKK